MQAVQAFGEQLGWSSWLIFRGHVRAVQKSVWSQKALSQKALSQFSSSRRCDIRPTYPGTRQQTQTHPCFLQQTSLWQTSLWMMWTGCSPSSGLGSWVEAAHTYWSHLAWDRQGRGQLQLQPGFTRQSAWQAVPARLILSRGWCKHNLTITFCLLLLFALCAGAMMATVFHHYG